MAEKPEQMFSESSFRSLEDLMIALVAHSFYWFCWIIQSRAGRRSKLSNSKNWFTFLPNDKPGKSSKESSIPTKESQSQQYIFSGWTEEGKPPKEEVAS